MNNEKKTKFLIYWHNGRGLGHTSRAAKIADGIYSIFKNSSILGITGASKGLELFHDSVDILKLPSFISKEGKYGVKVEPKLNISINKLFEIRSKIIEQIIPLYEPDVWIIDFHPYGKDGELVNAINLASCVKILGIRGVIKGVDETNIEFFSADISKFIDKNFQSIHVYIDPNILALDEIYDIPNYLLQKVQYTGYLSNIFLGNQSLARQYLNLVLGEKIIVVNFGGGDVVTHKWELILLSLCKNCSFYDKAFIMLGPYMSKKTKEKIQDLSNLNPKIVAYDWKKDFHIWMKASDLFIGAGGYNTLTDILGNNINSLLFPNQSIELEQDIHLKKLSILNYIRILDLSHGLANIKQQIEYSLENPCTIPQQVVVTNGKIENANLIKKLL